MESYPAQPRRPAPHHRPRLLLLPPLAALALGFLLPAAWCIAFLPQGLLPAAVAYHVSLTANLLIACLLYGSLAVAPLLILALPLSLCFPRARSFHKWALALLATIALLAPMLWFSRAVYWPLHHRSIRAVPPRAQGLVTAIEHYKADHGAPPPDLATLLPDYLPEPPATGLAAFQRFEYRLLPDSGPYAGRFELFVSCPYSYAGPSALLYWPEAFGYLHSWPEDARVRLNQGDWVYVNMK